MAIICPQTEVALFNVVYCLEKFCLNPNSYRKLSDLGCGGAEGGGHIEMKHLGEFRSHQMSKWYGGVKAKLV